MSASSDPQSSSLPWSESSWWSPSIWVPDATLDSASTLSTPFSPDWLSESDSPTLSWTGTWTVTELPTAARVTDAGPPSTPTFTHSALSSSPTLLMGSSSSVLPSRPIETQTPRADSTGQNLKGTAAKSRTGQIVAISVVTFVVLLAMASLFICFLIRFRIRKLGHQRLYSGTDRNFDDCSPTVNFLKNTGNGDDEVIDFSAAVGRTGSTRDRMPSQVLGWWYHNERQSLSDSEATPILQPSSYSPTGSPTERPGETSSLGWNYVHESPIIQCRSSVGDAHGPLSPLDPPRYSQILPMKPNVRPPRPLPVPKNPRPLMPQRRVDSVQVRKQKKPPLIPSSTTSLPLPSSTPISGEGLDAAPVPRNFLPLLPRRRTKHRSQASWPLSDPRLTPLAPLRPTPAKEHIPQTKHRTNQTAKSPKIQGSEEENMPTL